MRSDSANGFGTNLVNALTVDVEDWAHAYLDYDLPVADEVFDNTKRLLDLMEEYSVKATFFCLGVVAEKFPSLIRDIASAGHEIGVHGWRHRPLWDSDANELKRDLKATKEVLEQVGGVQVKGYRAPRFSVIQSTSWALDVVADCGFEYDSSVVPAKVPGKRYGMASTSLHPHVAENGMYEVPLTSLRVLRWRIPAAGGGYMRFLPLAAHRRAIKEMNQRGYPAVVYVHPHEFDPQLIKQIPHPIKLRTRLSSSFNRAAQGPRFRHLLSEFNFSTVENVLADWIRRTA